MGSGDTMTENAMAPSLWSDVRLGDYSRGPETASDGVIARSNWRVSVSGFSTVLVYFRPFRALSIDPMTETGGLYFLVSHLVLCLDVPLM